MTGALGKRAVVVGAGVGGLSTAGALSDYFEQLEIFERDRLSTFVGSRLGTPQDRHPHALLAGGLRALGALFPAFEDSASQSSTSWEGRALCSRS
jgi:protoporphyrinogen oxidase